jgi:bacterioferritin-associated ferredoxin
VTTELDELVAAVRELLAELDEVRGVRSECGECPPTVATEERLRVAAAAFLAETRSSPR